ncbi:Macro domain-containing protein [Spironucleus salmonicida]|uniref:Macro domain-containing protein n=1 Tax=Spironucleus salmonicida TaxID=348837 RepID=V6LMR9_9EUKA|nr:Macro domain-containing protein [Spironucleus salmonicida]|eukprot:EST42014.1 Macro domain-containing protein [Spironucleus salmonicida]
MDSNLLDESTIALPNPPTSHYDLLPQVLTQQLRSAKAALFSEVSRARNTAKPPPRPFQLITSTAKIANLGSLTNLPQAKNDINKHLCIVEGDLTQLATEAYIVPYGSTCELSARVHARCGISLQNELKRLVTNQRVGEAVQTPPYDLFQIDAGGQKYPLMLYHAIAPNQEDPQGLKSAYERALYLCASDGMKTISLPILSGVAYPTPGVEYYPLIGSIHVLLSVLRAWFERDDIKSAIDLVVIVCQNARETSVVNELMDLYFPFDDQNYVKDSLNDFETEVVVAATAKKGKKGKGKKGKK